MKEKKHKFHVPILASEVENITYDMVCMRAHQDISRAAKVVSQYMSRPGNVPRHALK